MEMVRLSFASFSFILYGACVKHLPESKNLSCRVIYANVRLPGVSFEHATVCGSLTVSSISTRIKPSEKKSWKKRASWESSTCPRVLPCPISDIGAR
jgi:hypothetical protein